MREDESARTTHVHLVALAPRNHLRDVEPDLRVVVPHAQPIEAVTVTESRVRDLRDDGRLRLQVRTRRIERATRRVHGAHRVLDRDELFPARLDVLLGAPQRREYECGLAGDEV